VALSMTVRTRGRGLKMANGLLDLRCSIFGHAPIPTDIGVYGDSLRVEYIKCVNCGKIWEVDYPNETLGDF